MVCRASVSIRRLPPSANAAAARPRPAHSSPSAPRTSERRNWGRIAALSPKDAAAVPSLAATAACLATWAGGLLFGVDGVAATVSLYRMAGDASLAAATTSLAATVRLRSRTSLVPSCPASLPKVSRGCRAAASGCSLTADPVTAWPIRLDSPLPPEMRRHGASVPTGASPHANRDTRHRGSRGTWVSSAASYGCRARAGFPPAVWLLPVWSEWLPTGHLRAAPNASENGTGTKAAPEQNAQQPCRSCAPAPFSAPSLPGFCVAQSAVAAPVSRRFAHIGPVVTGARCWRRIPATGAMSKRRDSRPRLRPSNPQLPRCHESASRSPRLLPVSAIASSSRGSITMRLPDRHSPVAQLKLDD